MAILLERDHNEQWEAGTRAIDDTVEAMRDDLRDKGLEDGETMEAIVMEERSKMQDELGRNIEGDFSEQYVAPDFNDIMSDLEVGQPELDETSDAYPEGLSDAEIDDICADIESSL